MATAKNTSKPTPTTEVATPSSTSQLNTEDRLYRIKALACSIRTLIDSDEVGEGGEANEQAFALTGVLLDEIDAALHNLLPEGSAA